LRVKSGGAELRAAYAQAGPGIRADEWNRQGGLRIKLVLRHKGALHQLAGLVIQDRGPDLIYVARVCNLCRKGGQERGASRRSLRTSRENFRALGSVLECVALRRSYKRLERRELVSGGAGTCSAKD